MAEHDFDLFVVGAGSAGVRAARMAGGFGARVAIAEDRYLGGTCVNVGCIPKKLLVYASHFSEDFEDAGGFGWTVGKSTFAWKSLIQRKDVEIERLHRVYAELLAAAGVTTIKGHAGLADPHTVVVDDKPYQAERIVVATGSWPVVPEFPGSEYVITSNDAFFLDELPQRVLIVGGGYIAVEFAGIFAALGSATTLIYRGPLFLRGLDHDIREFLAAEMTKKNVELVFNTTIEAVEKIRGQLKAHLSDGSQREAERIFYATGRTPNVKGLGLEALGAKLDARGAVIVNEDFRSSVPSIYAIGDVINRVKLTPVALAEGMMLAKTLYGGSRGPLNYTDIPTCIFSQPNVGTVGLTEEQAREQCGACKVYKSTFTPLKHTLSGRNEKTLIKLIVEQDSDRVVGAHMVGPDAGEIIQGIAIALKAGATKATFDATIGIHPTMAEEFVTMREFQLEWH
ncbi:MAG: glutathione-disulfide reductase [Gammaproteobacteria bacterium]|nr:glutathione-disulfide reductase [Gammaproteobacteria bacterium]